jgi:type I restriction enzyme S subunit
MYQKRVLRDLCSSINYGYTASASRDQVGPKFLRITDIAQNALDWDGVPYCPIEEKDLGKYRLFTGDIVIARTGATAGWAKYIADPPPAVFASYLVRIRLNEATDARFVGHVVESKEYKDFVLQHAGGAAQPNANAQVLTSFELPVPPLPIQRRIASILSAYYDLLTRAINIVTFMLPRKPHAAL